MKITNQAKQMILEILSENEAEGIRLYAVQGCCGPQFALSLEGPKDSDTVETINDIKVAFDSEVQGIDNLTLDTEETKDGTGLVLLGANNCC